MDLGAYQRGILALLKGAPPEGSDDYLRRLAGSEELQLAREVVLWWHAFRVERYCPLTSALLKRLHGFEPAVEAVFREAVLSHYIEETGAVFLRAMATRPSELVASVAQFEQALLRVKLGDPQEYRVAWDYDPRHVLEALVNDTALDLPAWRGGWVTVVSHAVPQMVQLLRAQTPAAESPALSASS